MLCFHLILDVIPCQPSPTGWDLCLQIMGLRPFSSKTITHQSAANRLMLRAGSAVSGCGWPWPARMPRMRGAAVLPSRAGAGRALETPPSSLSLCRGSASWGHCPAGVERVCALGQPAPHLWVPACGVQRVCCALGGGPWLGGVPALRAPGLVTVQPQGPRCLRAWPARPSTAGHGLQPRGLVLPHPAEGGAGALRGHRPLPRGRPPDLQAQLQAPGLGGKPCVHPLTGGGLGQRLRASISLL